MALRAGGLRLSRDSSTWLVFAEAKMEVAVLEVGMGGQGRRDQYQRPNRIRREKAGILRNHGVMVTLPPDCLSLGLHRLSGV